MYSGENVVILNYSEWIIQLGLYICYSLLLVLCTKLYIYSPSKAPNYLEYQTKNNWESKYLIDLKLKPKGENCEKNEVLLNLGKWIGIDDYTCLCHNENVFFTTTNKKICRHDSPDNKYKNIYLCYELEQINSENLIYFNDYIFCGKYSSSSISSYHETIINKFGSSDNIDNYRNILISLKDKEQGIIDIEYNKNKNYTNEGYSDQGNGLYIKKLNKGSINIFEFNEFIIDLHYSNELICSYDEMTNNNPINDFFKNTKNIYHQNKVCLNEKKEEYKKYYINDNFVRTSIIDGDLNIFKLNTLSDFYKNVMNILNYYNNIQNKINIDIISNSANNNILVAQKYLYGIGCQFYDTTKFYFSLFDYFYHNKNIALSIVVFTLITTVTAIIFISFNLYQNCVDYPLVYLTFSLILVISLITDTFLTGIYLGFSVYLKNYFNKILNECRIDFDGISNDYNYNPFFGNNYNKALPIETELYEDLNYVFYISLIMFVAEIIILILLIIYFIFNCYRYTFISLKNESGNIIDAKKVQKRDLMDLVKML